MPKFKVFSIVKRQNQDAYWQQIGIAFSHGDKKGINLDLNAMPLHGGTLVLRLERPRPNQSAEEFEVAAEPAADQVAEGENHE